MITFSSGSFVVVFIESDKSSLVGGVADWAIKSLVLDLEDDEVSSTNISDLIAFACE